MRCQRTGVPAAATADQAVWKKEWRRRLVASLVVCSLLWVVAGISSGTDLSMAVPEEYEWFTQLATRIGLPGELLNESPVPGGFLARLWVDETEQQVLGALILEFSDAAEASEELEGIETIGFDPYPMADDGFTAVTYDSLYRPAYQAFAFRRSRFVAYVVSGLTDIGAEPVPHAVVEGLALFIDSALETLAGDSPIVPMAANFKGLESESVSAYAGIRESLIATTSVVYGQVSGENRQLLNAHLLATEGGPECETHCQQMFVRIYLDSISIGNNSGDWARGLAGGNDCEVLLGGDFRIYSVCECPDDPDSNYGHSGQTLAFTEGTTDSFGLSWADFPPPLDAIDRKTTNSYGALRRKVAEFNICQCLSKPIDIRYSLLLADSDSGVGRDLLRTVLDAVGTAYGPGGRLSAKLVNGAIDLASSRERDLQASTPDIGVDEVRNARDRVDDEVGEVTDVMEACMIPIPNIDWKVAPSLRDGQPQILTVGPGVKGPWLSRNGWEVKFRVELEFVQECGTCGELAQPRPPSTSAPSPTTPTPPSSTAPPATTTPPPTTSVPPPATTTPPPTTSAPPPATTFYWGPPPSDPPPTSTPPWSAPPPTTTTPPPTTSAPPPTTSTPPPTTSAPPPTTTTPLSDPPQTEGSIPTPRPWPPNDVHFDFVFTFVDGTHRTGSMEILTGELAYGSTYGVPIPSSTGGSVAPEFPAEPSGASITFGAPEGEEYPSVTVVGSTEASIQVTGIQWTYDGEPIGFVFQPSPGQWRADRREPQPSTAVPPSSVAPPSTTVPPSSVAPPSTTTPPSSVAPPSTTTPPGDAVPDNIMNCLATLGRAVGEEARAEGWTWPACTVIGQCIDAMEEDLKIWRTSTQATPSQSFCAVRALAFFSTATRTQKKEMARRYAEEFWKGYG